MSHNRTRQVQVEPELEQLNSIWIDHAHQTKVGRLSVQNIPMPNQTKLKNEKKSHTTFDHCSRLRIARRLSPPPRHLTGLPHMAVGKASQTGEVTGRQSGEGYSAGLMHQLEKNAWWWMKNWLSETGIIAAIYQQPF